VHRRAALPGDGATTDERNAAIAHRKRLKSLIGVDFAFRHATCKAFVDCAPCTTGETNDEI
jgi:hypothetical protein